MVLFVYVDNSNVWIEGQRVSAVRKGMARSAWEAMEQDVLDREWQYDFGRLYELACPDEAVVGRSILFGSRPPPNDSLWERARRDGFEIVVFDRSAGGREKRVDTALTVTLTEDSFTYMQPARGDMAVIVAGDGDYVPAVESLQRRGLGVRAVFWEHAVSRDLRRLVDEYVPLDPHLESLAARRRARPSEREEAG